MIAGHSTQPVIRYMKSVQRTCTSEGFVSFSLPPSLSPPPPPAQILEHTVTRVTFSISHVLLFGNASSSYKNHVFGTLRLLLRFVARTVVCRIARFGGGVSVQLIALPRGYILSG